MGWVVSLSYSSTNTLVIGGAGFIGGNLVPQLINTGRRVTVLGRSAEPSYALHKNALYVEGDYGQHKLLSQLLDEHNEVIHLAYDSISNNPLTELLQNLSPSIQLFSEVAKRGIKLILVSSGGTVYGNSLKLPISEKHSTQPISSYGVVKLTIENYAHLYATSHGLNFICLRPANPYGEGQRPFLGQGFISTAIASVIRKLPITVYGEHGTIRDYLYVSDLASGIVSALEHGHLSETYNLGSSIGLSNIEVIQAIKHLISETESEFLIKHEPERIFDVKVNVLDSTKILKHTGWKAQVDFKTGLQLTYDWLKNSKN